MPKGKHDILWDMIVNASFLGRIWGITMRRVQELGAQGVIPKKDRGRYVLGPACLTYAEYQRMNPSGGKGFDLTDERTRLTRFQADNEEMKKKQMSGELFPAESVLKLWERHIMDCRSRLLALPTKIAPVAYACKTIQEVQAATEKLVHEALNELKSIEVSDYAKDVEAEVEPEPKKKPNAKKKAVKRTVKKKPKLKKG